MTPQQIIDQRSLRSEFSNKAIADNYVWGSVSPASLAVILGDNGRFWVLPNKYASILVKNGFEYAD